MADVYSTQLCEVASYSGPAELVFTVPADQLLVVRCMSIVYGDVTGSGMDAWFQTGNLTKLVRYTWAASLSDPTNYGGVFLANGRWVMGAGETLSIQTAAGTADFFASGYLLTLP